MALSRRSRVCVCVHVRVRLNVLNERALVIVILIVLLVVAFVDDLHVIGGEVALAVVFVKVVVVLCAVASGDLVCDGVEEVVEEVAELLDALPRIDTESGALTRIELLQRTGVVSN